MTQREIDKKIDELYDEIERLDSDEEDTHGDEIRELRNQIAELEYTEPEPEEFELEVVIKGTVTVKAVTYKEAEAMAYDECKNHDFIAVQRVEIEEA